MIAADLRAGLASRRIRARWRWWALKRRLTPRRFRKPPAVIVTGPVSVWVAPVGTPFPDVNDNPASPWQRIG